jgi:acyl carrier protein/D-alanine--poly(phosphoribitol) ligase subunit 2
MEKPFKDEIRDFIIKTFMAGKGSIADGDSLFASNILDSFGMLELIAFIEKNYKINVTPSEVTLNNFDSLDKIIQLIQRKQALNRRR